MRAMPNLTTTASPRQSIFAVLSGTWADRLLLLVALAGIASSWFWIQTSINNGPVVADIYHADTLMASYPLPQAGEKPIHVQVEGSLGTTDIVLDTHGARIVSSPCTTQRCVLAGAHQHAGDIVACVPNQVLVALRGKASSAFDAVVE